MTLRRRAPSLVCPTRVHSSAAVSKAPDAQCCISAHRGDLDAIGEEGDTPCIARMACKGAEHLGCGGLSHLGRFCRRCPRRCALDSSIWRRAIRSLGCPVTVCVGCVACGAWCMVCEVWCAIFNDGADYAMPRPGAKQSVVVASASLPIVEHCPPARRADRRAARHPCLSGGGGVTVEFR